MILATIPGLSCGLLLLYSVILTSNVMVDPEGITAFFRNSSTNTLMEAEFSRYYQCLHWLANYSSAIIPVASPARYWARRAIIRYEYVHG